MHQVVYPSLRAGKDGRVFAEVDALINAKARPESGEAGQAGRDVTIVEVCRQAEPLLDQPWDSAEMIGRYRQEEDGVEISVALDEPDEMVSPSRLGDAFNQLARET